jgi:hypothetical protein
MQNESRQTIDRDDAMRAKKVNQTTPSSSRRFRYRVNSCVLVLVVVMLAAFPGASIAWGAPAASQTAILNMATNRLDGVLLISETPTRHFGIAETKVISALEARLGKAQIFSSTICRMKLPVKVARWHDLSLAFENGLFAMLVYNYHGWPMAFVKMVPLPPVGSRLTPLVKTNFGIGVGDSAARVKTLDPHIRGSAQSSFFVGAYTSLATTKRTGEKGSPDDIYQVSQIQVATGNC